MVIHVSGNRPLTVWQLAKNQSQWWPSPYTCPLVSMGQNNPSKLVNKNISGLSLDRGLLSAGSFIACLIVNNSNKMPCYLMHPWLILVPSEWQNRHQRCPHQFIWEKILSVIKSGLESHDNRSSTHNILTLSLWFLNQEMLYSCTKNGLLLQWLQ